MDQIVQPRMAVPGIATTLLMKECPLSPFPVCGAELFATGAVMNTVCCHLLVACLIPGRSATGLHVE